MSIDLQGLIGRNCLANLEYVIIYSKRISDHPCDIRKVFIRVAMLECSLNHQSVIYFRKKFYISDMLSTQIEFLRIRLNFEYLLRGPVLTTLRVFKLFSDLLISTMILFRTRRNTPTFSSNSPLVKRVPNLLL